MFEGWTASVDLIGAAAFAHNQAAKHRSDVQARLSALSRATNLRYVDDQSVAALAATLDAIGTRSLDEFRDCAIVAAPRAIGRIMLAASMEKFAQEGAWGVSPQIIPNGSLHSVSGLLSVALGMVGPNIGAGGVPGREGEAFLAAVSMLHDEIAACVWVVLTGCDEQSTRAVVMTLRSPDATQRHSDRGTHLALRTDSPSARSVEPLTLESLFAAVTTSPDTNRRWSLPGGLSLAWRVPASVEAVA